MSKPKKKRKRVDTRTPFHAWLDALSRHAGIEPIPPAPIPPPDEESPL